MKISTYIITLNGAKTMAARAAAAHHFRCWCCVFRVAIKETRAALFRILTELRAKTQWPIKNSYADCTFRRSFRNRMFFESKKPSHKNTHSLTFSSIGMEHTRCVRASYKLTPYEYLMSSMFDKLFVVLNLCMASCLRS